ncbi:MAG: hypothetical protein HYS81_03110 [Candidatus Aenigmatarchaeota archaeon]|nr:MAG: hypothetical protein HYS81_03110 [Candidatus Aenigmarchaeota archaeon]
MDLEVLRSSLEKVYSKPSYHIITFVASTLTLVFYVALTNLPLITTALASGYPIERIAQILVALVLGLVQSAGIETAASVMIVATLVGTNVSLLVYRVRAYGFNAKQGGSGLGGFALGALGAGCPACATGLLSLLGVAGGLAALPFQGWELRILSIALLTAPIYWLSKDIANNGACPIPKRS